MRLSRGLIPGAIAAFWVSACVLNPAATETTSTRRGSKEPPAKRILKKPTPSPDAADGGGEDSGAVGVDRPIIFSFDPSAGAVGQEIAIKGQLFTGDPLVVSFGGIEATGVNRSSDTTIRATVPAGATTSDVVVSVGDRTSDRIRFTVVSTLGAIAPAVSELKVGAREELEVEAFDGEKPVGGVLPRWKTSDDEIVDVDKDGEIEAKAAGVATVTAELGSLSRHLVVTVVPFTSTVSTVAGASAGELAGPLGLALDASGTVLVADAGSHRVRLVTSAGAVGTFAGDGTANENNEATRLASSFNALADVAVTASGEVFVADKLSHELRLIAASGEVSTLVGGDAGYASEADPADCLLDSPQGVAVDASGTVYVADTGNHVIRKLSADRTSFTLLAGTPGTPGANNATGVLASFSSPTGLAIGPDGALYVADAGNHLIRRIDVGTGEVTTWAGAGEGLTEGPRAQAKFKRPLDLAFDAAGRMLVADSGNHRIRRIATDGTVATAAGSSEGLADGKGAVAQFKTPSGVAVDGQGRVWVSDTGNNRLRRVTID